MHAVHQFSAAPKGTQITSPRDGRGLNDAFESGLLKTRRAALEIMEKAPSIESVGRTSNFVFPLKYADKPMAYLKIGKKGNQASAQMERFVWEIAKIFEVQDSFAPTTEIDLTEKVAKKFSVEVPDDKEGSGGEKVYKRCSLSDVANISKIKGSLQAAEKGMPLSEFITQNRTLEELNSNRDQVIKHLITAVGVSLCFGMRDANASNIIIFDDASYRFIDNCRDFAHSNGAILLQGGIKLSYRCGFLQLDECYFPLTPQQKLFAMELVAKFDKKLPAFENYLKDEEVKKRIKEFPFGWFDADQVLAATRERIARLSSAVKDENVNTIFDLICATIPYYRLFTLFYFLEDKMKSWKDAAAGAAIITLNVGMEICRRRHINPYNLLGISMQNNLPHYSLCEELSHMPSQELSENTLLNFMKQFYDIARIDLKDSIVENSEKYIKTVMECYFAIHKIPIKKNSIYYVDTMQEPFQFICGNKRIPLDLYSVPGKIKIMDLPELEAMKPGEFKSWAELQISL